MLDNLIFSLNRVMPFFLLILIGAFLRRRKIVGDVFFRQASTYTFRCALPVSLFVTISSPGEKAAVSARLVWYAGISTVVVFAVIWLATELIFRDKTIVGTLVQGAFRGNFALLGVPLVAAVAGASAAQQAAFAMIVVIPLYNILAVTALTVRGSVPGRPSASAILRGIVTNPLILAIALALPFFFFELPIPYMAEKTLSFVGQTATPMGLLSIGGLFRLRDAAARLGPALYASAIKILIQPGVMLPLSYALGFRGEDLLVLLVLYASPVAVSSTVMATAMNGDGPLASNILILTTLLSAPVFAAGIYILSATGML